MAFEFGSAFVRVVAFLDRKQITAESAAAGDAAGAALNTAVTKKLTANQQLGKAIGLSLAGAFGVATARGLELEQATARVRAETGLTGKAAEQLGSTINRLAGKNLASIEEIAGAFSKVHNDLGLTGQAAEDATQSFLTFARATGQDAAGSVKAFDDILDGFNLTADKSAGIMDQLVVSHQKFGGSITTSQAALAAMAPALQAMNLGVDDGIKLLNLFAASGIDASDAAGLLRLAVKNLKPGQDLNDLVAQLGAIEDPTLRAQKAIELFGRSGAKIANAIKPGTVSLDEYAVSAADSVGATDKAREALDSTFGAQVQLLLHQFGATVTDVLGGNGPVINAIAGLTTLAGSLGLDKVIKKAWTALGGSAVVKLAVGAAGTVAGAIYGAAVTAGQALVGGLTALWGRIPGSAVVGGAISKAGSLMGTTMGKVASAAFGIAFVIGLALALPDIVAASYDVGQKIRKAITGDTPDSERVGLEAGAGVADAFIAAAASHIATGAPTIQLALRAAFNTEHGIKAPAGDWQTAGIQTPDQSGAFAKNIAEGTGAAQDAINAANKNWDEAQAKYLASIGVLPPAAKRVGYDTLQQMADGITSARQLPLDAFDQLVEMMKHPLTQSKETARLIGELTGKALAEGLASADPAIRAQAKATKEAILERLNEIEPRAGTVSKAAMDALVVGLGSKDKEIRAAALGIYQIIEAQLALKDAKLWAQHAANAYAEGFASRADYLAEKTREFLAGAAHQIIAMSPPKAGPLKDIDKWGEATGRAWVDAFVGALGSTAGKIGGALGGVQGQLGAAAGLVSPGPGSVLGDPNMQADVGVSNTQYFNSDTSGLSGYAVTNPDLTRDLVLPGGVTYHTAGGSQQPAAPTINVYNPTPEPASQSVPDALRMIGAFG